PGAGIQGGGSVSKTNGSADTFPSPRSFQGGVTGAGAALCRRQGAGRRREAATAPHHPAAPRAGPATAGLRGLQPSRGSAFEQGGAGETETDRRPEDQGREGRQRV